MQCDQEDDTSLNVFLSLVNIFVQIVFISDAKMKSTLLKRFLQSKALSCELSFFAIKFKFVKTSTDNHQTKEQNMGNVEMMM